MSSVRTSVRPSPLLNNKTNFKRKKFTGESLDLAEWIIDDTCIVHHRFLLQIWLAGHIDEDGSIEVNQVIGFAAVVFEKVQ